MKSRACVPFIAEYTLCSFINGLFLTIVTEPPNLKMLALIEGWFLDTIVFAKSISQSVSKFS